MNTVFWQPDHLGDGFEMTDVEHPTDYSGAVRKGDPKEKYFRADAILDVRTISYYGNLLGSDVT